jgi:4-amino-4-deoxy-L-arabinose transferase-like glycosyltransferase
MSKIKLSFLIFLFFFLANLLVMNKIIWDFDGHSVLEVTKSIVDRGGLNIPCFFGEKSLSGRCYSRYGISMSIFLIPFYILDKIFNINFFIFFLNPMVTGLISVLIFLFLRKMKFESRESLIGSSMFNFSTFALVYSRTLFAEPLITLFIYMTFYLVFFGEKKSHTGIYAGLAFLTKTTGIIVSPFIFIYYFLQKKYKLLTMYIFYLIVSLFIFCLYNYFRFGGLLKTGYPRISFNNNVFHGLSYFFLSSGGSIFIFQPILLISVFGIKYFVKSGKQFFIYLTSFILLFTIIHSVYSDPEGGFSWGPRLLYPIIPYLVFLVMFSYKNIKTKIFKFIFLVLILISIFIQLLSVSISYHRYLSFFDKKYGDKKIENIFFEPKSSPILGQLKMIFKIDYDYKDKIYWQEAFLDRKKFDISRSIGPFDLYLLWSRKNLLLLFLGIVFEINLLRLINKKI